MQDIFGDECPSKATIYRWIERFDNGDKVRHDDPLPGCATSSKTRRNIEEDRRITLRELEERVGISKATLHSIITEDLEMSKDIMNELFDVTGAGIVELPSIIPNHHVDAIQRFWSDDGIQECFRRRSQFQLIDSAQ
ncbi:guanine nucleotide-binding protein (G protein), subunit alpha [Oopsacas minuta]|uniref:Guanine nucleotide-binding protein (G protein), subunit alpha n=1 Tax=Oopsacas minuta TaxID=111878 RepID=A0AAV7JBU5_9METZ|nr:guanine nucleotide-binding protein (G protein), subunit alpha [Oopsacas minuta]